MLSPAILAILKAGDAVAGGEVVGADLAALLVEVARGQVTLPRGLRLREVRITGDFDIEALKLDFPLYLNACTFEGVVVLRHVQTRGLFLEGARFEQVVDARDSVVHGQVVLRHCEFLRPALWRDMRVDGQFNLLGARLPYADDGAPRNWMEAHAWGQTLSLARARLGGLRWEKMAVAPAALIDLTDCSAGSFVAPLALREDPCSWPSGGGVLMDGFKPLRLDHVPAEDLLDWLALSPTFAPSAYRNVAAVLRGEGMLRDEERISAALRRREVAHIPQRARRWFFRLVFGLSDYGQHSARVLRLSLVCLAAAWAVAAASSTYRLVAPVADDLVTEQCYYAGPRCGEAGAAWRPFTLPGGTPRYLPLDYPGFAPLRFTVERTLPLLDTEQRDRWDIAVPWLSYLHRLLAAAALFLAGLFLGTISGLVRPSA